MQSVFNSVLARWLEWLWKLHWYTAWSTLYSYDTVEQRQCWINYRPEKKNTSDLMLVDLQMQKCLNMTNKFSNAVHLDHSCSGFTMNTQRAVVPWEWKSFRGRESPEYRQSRPCPDTRENMLKLRCRKRDSIYKWNRNRPCGEQCGAAGVYQWIWFQVVKIFAFTLKFYCARESQ